MHTEANANCASATSNVTDGHKTKKRNKKMHENEATALWKKSGIGKRNNVNRKEKHASNGKKKTPSSYNMTKNKKEYIDRTGAPAGATTSAHGSRKDFGLSILLNVDSMWQKPHSNFQCSVNVILMWCWPHWNTSMWCQCRFNVSKATFKYFNVTSMWVECDF